MKLFSIFEVDYASTSLITQVEPIIAHLMWVVEHLALTIGPYQNFVGPGARYKMGPYIS